jgi:hypothetical protein
VLLNDVQFVEAARVLAQRVMKEEKSDSKRIKRAFLYLAAREPDDKEAAILMDVYMSQMKDFVRDPKLAAKLISQGDTKADPSLPTVNLAGMTVMVQTIMNSDAVVWRR